MGKFNWQRSKYPEPFLELARQRWELKQQRRELVQQLYELIAELEGRPAWWYRDAGFPFSILVRLVRKALNRLEAFIRRRVAVYVAR